MRPFSFPSSLSVSPAAHPIISNSTNRSLAAMILNRDNSISKSPGGRMTSTYVLFVNRARIKLKRGALMAISANGWDAVEEWVYFLLSTLGQLPANRNRKEATYESECLKVLMTLLNRSCRSLYGLRSPSSLVTFVTVRNVARSNSIISSALVSLARSCK